MKYIIILIGLVLVACNRQTVFDLAPASQTFAQQVRYNSKVDIVWVVDNSGSMKQHQERLSQQINSFMDTLLSAKLEFHLAVLSTDMGTGGSGGRFIGAPNFIRWTDSDPRGLLQQRFVIGEDGSNLERGLQSLTAALSASKLSLEHQGFLREDALLAVIFLSDEDDHSAESADSVIHFLDAIKSPFEDGSRRWIANFIGVTELSSSCRTFNQYADPGEKYMAIARESQGVIATICTADLRVGLSNIKKRIVQILTDYKLDRKPIIESIRVYVNGVLMTQDETNGWSYVEEINAVRFNGLGVPSAESSIHVDYKPKESL